MKVLAVIPARGGSKGIPRKNIAPLGGKPLIAWTVSAAREAKGVTRVVVSTDDTEIANCARSAGAEVPFLRPANLAGDTVLALPVIAHALTELKNLEDWQPDVVVYLQPTSPFRRATDIDAALNLLRADPTADTVVSVVAVPHNLRPASLMKQLPDGSVEFTMPAEQRIFRRQEKGSSVLVARNGPALLVLRREVIERGRLYGERILSLQMDYLRSLDIDEPLDLVIAEKLLPLVSD